MIKETTDLSTCFTIERFWIERENRLPSISEGSEGKEGECEKAAVRLVERILARF
jgi:hypothetical protein